MLVKSQIFGPMSGKMNGMVASHNAGGAYLRTLTIPTDPASSFQTTLRAIVGSLSQRWTNDLTQAQRDAWAVYALNTNWKNRLGDSIKLSGINHYVRSNTPRLQAGLAAIDTAPTIFDLGNNPVISNLSIASGVGASITFKLAGANNPAVGTSANTCLVFASRPQNPAINFFAGSYRYADKESLATSAIQVAMPFSTKVGDKVFVSVEVSMSDGRLSGHTKTSALVT